MLGYNYDERSGIVGGPVTSVETVGVDPEVGGLVSMLNGEGVGGVVLHMSTKSQLPFMNDPLPKLWLQHMTTELKAGASATKNSLEQVTPSKKKTWASQGVGAGVAPLHTSM